MLSVDAECFEKLRDRKARNVNRDFVILKTLKLGISKKLLRKLMKSEKSVDVDQLDFDTALFFY